MKTTKNRWLIAMSAIAIHLSIGSAYAYSVYTYPISEQMGWSATEVTIAFTIMMALAGSSAALFGKFVERNGPRKSAMVAAVLFGLGQAGSGVAIALGSLPLFLLTYGVASGLGIGYISPVSTLVKWFPDRRGLATGMAVLGFWDRGSYYSTDCCQLNGINRHNFYLLLIRYLLFYYNDARCILYRPSFRRMDA